MKVWKGYQNGNPVCIKAVRGDAVVNLDEVKRVRGASDLDERMNTT